MYVTRPLSYYKSFPETLSLAPEGPNSGHLVLQDQESETYTCFGLCKNRYLEDLPFPQNKTLTTRYESGSSEHRHVSLKEVVFIPVLNQPLSSNRYYAIQPRGSHKGEAFTCSKEEDMRTCCFCNCVRDVKPRPFNPHEVYQQFEVVPDTMLCQSHGIFHAKSLAPDGFPPQFLRRKRWQIYTKTPKNYELHEAKGTNVALRARLPEFTFPPSTITSDPVIVGKWYCPFMFVKEGTLDDQLKRSIFYEMTLEQRWERIYGQENEHNKEGNIVSVKTAIQSEAAFVGEMGKEAIWDERNIVDGTIWFKTFRDDGVEEESVGLGLEIFERMRWEEERFGWIGGGENRIERVKREEKFEGTGEWRRFGFYVLVERFLLKRMDGRLVLAYDFKHIHQIKSMFE